MNPGAGDPLAVERLRERLAAEARRVRRDDLIQMLDDLPAVDEAGPIRVVVVGETKRGKSTLLNTLVGRPDLSPVGADLTTSCWLEVGYGDRDEAEVVLADPAVPGELVRRACPLRDVERYVAIGKVTEPVIGVQVRIASPMLHGITLVDTPGVGGLDSGHSRTTLAALRAADALLLVCDSLQPVLKPELDFLTEAALRVPTVVVAVTKCDINPAFEDVVDATREIITGRAGLESVPVLPVAPPLADDAAQMEDTGQAQWMQEISGIPLLVDTLREYSAAGAAATRLANAARVLAQVCRTLRNRSDEIVDMLDGNADREREVQREIAAARTLLDDLPRLAGPVHQGLDQLRDDAATSFDQALDALCRRYRSRVDEASAGLLSELPSRLTADITAAAVAVLEDAAERSAWIIAGLGPRLDGADHRRVTPERFVIRMRPAARPDAQGGCIDLPASAQLFTTLVNLLAGAAGVPFLPGPVVVAASLALAGGTGWLTSKGNAEQEQRARLAAWIDDATAEAGVTFRAAIGNRIREAERRVSELLPALVGAREREFTRLSEDLATVRSTAKDLRRALDEQRAVADGLRDVEREIDVLVSRTVAVHP
ncbi:dynamin family protein [Pseudonocardia sp. DSM 110487]|uniref:dynamin family protein n=1 Tax=Pseudonocardia sp. DSM 110487 TaxID=2865833 RepID=UPI001C6A7ABF|nr:dynamin family protein [Pseudonocardia sp. DSM 110487]QYN38300.1 dynamin family protein [Pseudonocardia sp. DSM 110487]